MLHFRLASDLHLEFCYDAADDSGARQHVHKVLPPLQTDKDSVLIIAGDLATIYKVSRIATFLSLVQPRFQHVIYVLGNHEHYHGSLAEGEQAVLNAINASGLEKDAITVAGNQVRVVSIGGAHFICATLWTDYFGLDPKAMRASQARLNDHRLIAGRAGLAVTPEELADIHEESVKHIERALQHTPDPKRTVVVTHHLPSFSAVDPRYTLTATDRLINGAFSSNLDWLMQHYNPAYWCFGHTHTPYAGKVGATTLLCNPGGYPDEGNVAVGRYNPAFVVPL